MPPGNIVNGNTEWNITGSLITKISQDRDQIICKDQTLLIPVRYRTWNNAMAVCSQLGHSGLNCCSEACRNLLFSDSFLAPFEDFNAYKDLAKHYLKNLAINEFCRHGSRYMLWLPYRGFTNSKENVQYILDEKHLKMNNAWRNGVPRTTARPWCVIARFGM